jgi:glycine dehydrogenase subunit 1
MGEGSPVMADFIPHTPHETREMLDLIGVSSLEDLLSPYPKEHVLPDLSDIPSGMTESSLMRRMKSMASLNRAGGTVPIFRGAGAYDHFIPEAVSPLVTRGEFLTAYTPYQPEVSQGLLQVMFEYQTAIANLYEMDLSNASVYDGATALAEACLVAHRHEGRSTILISEGVDPDVIKVVRTYVEGVGCQLKQIPLVSGKTRIEDVVQSLDSQTACFVGTIPTFWGTVEDFSGFADALHQNGSLLILHANPHALAVLRTPGSWGADLATGEGQPLGIPLSGGGPYLGILTASRAFMRKIPGRLVGKTVDREGRTAYVLTLQAREQHIRREKANSNICSNETLLSIVAVVTLSLLGPAGFREAAEGSMKNARKLRARLLSIPGISPVWEETPFFHEFILEMPMESKQLSRLILSEGFLSGLPLAGYPSPGGDNRMLWCATEMRTDEEIENLGKAVEKVLARHGGK